MSDTIWKFPIPLEDEFELEMPLGAAILCVQVQGEEPCIWARVDPKAKKHRRVFRLAGTGREIPKELGYIGTFQLRGGTLVFHLFERHSFSS